MDVLGTPTGHFGSDVENGSIPVFDATLAADFRRGQMQASDQLGTSACASFQSANVLFRMMRTCVELRLDVFKGERMLVS
jgi:hypothetical protein